MRPTTYRTYSDEEIAYIRAHCNEPPRKIAEALGAPYSTMLMYTRQMRKGTFTESKYPPQKYYALYLKKTDELVCSGTAEECAEALGIGVRAFYVRVCKALTGRTNKWEVYVEPYRED